MRPAQIGLSDGYAAGCARANYRRDLPLAPNDLRFSDLPNADSSRTLRCANDSFAMDQGRFRAKQRIGERAATACCVAKN
jgi:hypothetical protein